VELDHPVEVWIGWYDRQRKCWRDAGAGSPIDRPRVIAWAPMPRGMGAGWLEDGDD
jgi:hypothetical protein